MNNFDVSLWIGKLEQFYIYNPFYFMVYGFVCIFSFLLLLGIMQFLESLFTRKQPKGFVDVMRCLIDNKVEFISRSNGFLAFKEFCIYNNIDYLKPHNIIGYINLVPFFVRDFSECELATIKKSLPLIGSVIRDNATRQFVNNNKLLIRYNCSNLN